MKSDMLASLEPDYTEPPLSQIGARRIVQRWIGTAPIGLASEVKQPTGAIMVPPDPKGRFVGYQITR